MNIIQGPDPWAHVAGRASSHSGCRGIVPTGTISSCLATPPPWISWGCCARVGRGGLLQGHSAQSGHRPRCPHLGASVQGRGESPAQPTHAVPPQRPQPAAQAEGQQVPALPARMQSSGVTPELCRCSSSPGGS